MKIKWNSLEPSEFEALCARILELHHFTNLVWHGAGGGDRGRDLTAERITKVLEGVTNVERWIVQCKRYTVRPPNKAEIHDWLVSCREHDPGYVLLITCSTLSSNTKDWLKSVGREFPFQILIWEKRDLEREVVTKRRHLIDQFPALYSEERELFELNPLDTSEYRFSIDKFEVFVGAINCENEAEAEDKIRMFLEFVRNRHAIFLTGRPQPLPDDYESRDSDQA